MENLHTLPLLPLRNIVVFPHMSVGFDVIREKSMKALDAAMNGNKEIFLVTQRDAETEEPSVTDLYKIGVIAKIEQTAKAHKGASRVMVKGICRARLCKITAESPYIVCIAEELKEKKGGQMIMNEGFVRSLENIFDEYFTLTKNVPPQTFIAATQENDPGCFADGVAANINLGYRIKQEFLEESDPYVRTEKIIAALSKEIEVLKVSREIEIKVKGSIEKNQREYFLREELKVIERELGRRDGTAGEADTYRATIKKLHLKKEVAEKLLKEVSRFEKMSAMSSDSSVIRNYLDTVLALPWNRQTRENIDIIKAKEVLDADHYGLEKVKSRILEYLAVRKMTGGREGSVICLVGPPGTGKTSVAKSVARALNRKYVRISLGGIHDEADIRGHRKTYIGAMQGRIMSAVMEAKVKNPLILLDEIDKMGSDYRGDPAAALLEVLDFEQNFAFRDHFIEVPFDLSNVMFIATANTLETIPAPLLDRIEVIEISGYTNQEKACIAERYLLPKQMKKNGLENRKITVELSAVNDIITYYTRESGVRGLEREIGSLMRKAAEKFLSENRRNIKITSKNITSYLGKHRFRIDEMNDDDDVGIVRGLAWTSVGGDTLSVEVNVMPGSGKIELTGNLGDVMKESAMAAVSYIRTRTKQLGIYDKFYKTCDIHLHVPEGAVPKDGPSAGITIATAVASALTGYPVRRDVAMTGEITLRGRVLPIGGLREKSVAAYRIGIKTVIIPQDNLPDLDDVPETVRSGIRFIPVKNMDEVLKAALQKNKKEQCFIIPEVTEDNKKECEVRA